MDTELTNLRQAVTGAKITGAVAIAGNNHTALIAAWDCLVAATDALTAYQQAVTDAATDALTAYQQAVTDANSRALARRIAAVHGTSECA